MKLFSEKNFHLFFKIGVIIKAVDSILEIVLGSIFYIADPGLISAQSFWASLLLAHGIVKIFLIWGLLHNKLWAFPLSALVFSCFVLYQIHDFLTSHSPFVVLITIFDAFLIVLILHEYRHRLQKSGNTI